jgi:putative flippase GtrA
MLQKVINLLLQYRSLHRWALVGVITFTIDYVIFISTYSLTESVLLANFCAGLISISINYSAHYLWSFKSKADHSKSGIKYLLNLTIFWLVSTLLLKALITAGIEAKYAKLIPVPIIAPLSFLSLKFIVFSKPKSDN